MKGPLRPLYYINMRESSSTAAQHYNKFQLQANEIRTAEVLSNTGSTGNKKFFKPRPKSPATVLKEQQERNILRRSNLCSTCCTYKSASGTCMCY